MRRWTQSLLLVVAAVAVAACGSANTTGPAGSQPTTTTTATTTTTPTGDPHVVVITNSTTGTTSAAVGDLVEVELTSQSYGRGGQIVPWGTPTSSDRALLALIGAPAGASCPVHATCTFFSARGAGDATIRAIGPSGIICNSQGSDCVGVTAILREFPVHITAG